MPTEIYHLKRDRNISLLKVGNISKYIILKTAFISRLYKARLYQKVSFISPFPAPFISTMSQVLCCEEMENAVLEGTIKNHEIVERKEEFNAMIIEAIKLRIDKSVFFGLLRRADIVSKDIILKYCCFCGRKLESNIQYGRLI